MLRAKYHGGLTGFLILCVTASTCAGAAPQRSQRRPGRRAAPPTQWEPVVRDTFERNAFSRLDGTRPAFGIGPDAVGADRRQPSPDDDEEFDRSAVMRQLKGAMARIEEMLASEQAVAQPTPQAREAIEAIITLGRRLANDDPDYSADVHYVRHANEMANAARRLNGLLGTAEHGEARDTIRAIGSSCTACHNQFNP